MRDLQIPNREAEIIVSELIKTANIDGDVVEFGCYAGDTSIELAKALKDTPDKWLYLYDSFEGLPEKTAADQSSSGWRFQVGELKVSPDTVAHKFKKYGLPDPVIVKGWFDELTDDDLPAHISFALFDGDFYESIKASFEKVTPRLNKGAIIVIHDYRNPDLPGSAKAVNEFVSEHPDEYDFRLAASLAILVKK